MKTSTLGFLSSGGFLIVCLSSACSTLVVGGGFGNGGAGTAADTSSSAGVTTSVTSLGGVTGEGGSPYVSTGADTTAGSSTTASSSSTSGGFGGAGGSPPSTTGGGAGACSAAKETMVWGTMDKAPIMPPSEAASLNLTGLTIQQAENILCPGTMLGDMFGDMTAIEAWGENQEVWLDYSPTTMKAIMVSLWPGYTGNISFHSADGANSYTIGIGTVITKNGAPFTLQWGFSMPMFNAELDELYQGLVATFGPSLEPAGDDCVTTNQCVIGEFGDMGFVFFRPLGLTLWVDSVTQPQPTPSIASRLDSMPL